MNFARNRFRDTAFCIAMLLIMVVWLVPACYAADASEAEKAISQSDRDLNSAYVKVAEANSAGADVSELVGKLNTAGNYLSRANAAFKSGDYASASVLAADCSNTIKGVVSEAANLKSYAQGVHNSLLLSAIFVSVLGVVFVIVSGFVGWRFLRRRYFRRVLDKQLKVAFCL